MEPQTNIFRPRPLSRSASVPLPRNTGLRDAEESLFLNLLLAHMMSPDITSNSRVNLPPNGTQPTASSSARPANSSAAGHDIHGPSSNPARGFPTARDARRSARFSTDAIDLDAYRKPTLSTSVAEREAFNTTMIIILDKQTKGELVVAEELLLKLSSVLHVNGEYESAHVYMEDRNFVGWKSSDSECPNFSQYLEQIQILVTFFERPAAKHQPIIDLVKEFSRGSQTCGWNPSWNRDQQVSMARRLLWAALSFDRSIPIIPTGDVTFAERIDLIFHPISPLKAPKSFSHNLLDILEVGLSIEPTTNFNEHLLMTDNVIKIFKIDIANLFGLGAYKNNKVAAKLGLSTLGGEIFASLNVLYAKDRLFKRGGELGLGSDWDAKSNHELISAFFSAHTSPESPPKILASRAYALDELIKKRRRWWVALIRDIRRNAREQPFLFWGAVLAIFFGICSIIQTVSSVWSLVLAIRAS